MERHGSGVCRAETVTELFEAQAERTPDAVAVVFEEPAELHQLSYGELNRRANQLAHYLGGWEWGRSRAWRFAWSARWRWWWGCWAF